MIENGSAGSHNNFEKTSNPFKKIVYSMKNFMKKSEEDSKPSSFETSKPEKNPDSNTQRYEAYKKREARRAMRERKATRNEQKLPAKFKKGW